jgi:anti-anti-sigma factor
MTVLPDYQASPTLRREPLKLSTEWLNTTVVRISVAGEVDASNTSELREYIFHRAANCRNLIVDLQNVTFFATAAFTALRTVDVRCGRASVSWMLVPSHAVTRVLEICDPNRTLPYGAA